MPSPWEAALGGRVEHLRPELRAGRLVGLPATRWMPERLLEAGFVFRHADQEATLRGILHR